MFRNSEGVKDPKAVGVRSGTTYIATKCETTDKLTRRTRYSIISVQENL